MSDPAAELRTEVGRLTDGPVDGFVAARTARVKELRAAGRRDLATALAAVRRPTLPAWAVDQLAHHHAEELDALFDAAVRLRTAQAEGADRARLREGTRSYAAAVRRLRTLAEERLGAAGSTGAGHLDEVEATLLAAASDAELAAEVRAGALVRPAPAPGFAAFAPTPASARAADGATPDATEATDAAGVADAVVDDEVARARQERRVRAERRLDELRMERAALERSVGTTDDRLAALADGQAERRRRLEELRQQAAAVEAELTVLADDVRQVQERRDAASADLARVVRELADTESELDG